MAEKIRYYKCPYKYCLHPDEEVASNVSTVVGNRHWHPDCAWDNENMKGCVAKYMSTQPDNSTLPIAYKIIATLMHKYHVPYEYIEYSIDRSSTYFSKNPPWSLYGLKNRYWEKDNKDGNWLEKYYNNR